MNHFFIILLIALPISVAFGQDTDTLTYEFDPQVSGQLKRGVFSQTSARVDANTKVENIKLVFTNQSSYTYTEVNGTIISDDWHFRSILMLKPQPTSRLLPAFAHNYIKNVLYRINGSHRALTGLRMIPFKKKKDFSFILGAGYEFSNYSNNVFVNSPLESNQRDFALAFFNISGKHKLGKLKILLEYNFSSVQSFKEASDYSIWLTSGLSVPLNEKLSVGLKYDYRFRNVHLENLPSVNDLLLFNIRMKLTNLSE
jgi:hypothetical protein